MSREIKFRAFQNGVMMPYVNILLVDEMKAYPHGRGWIHNCQDWEDNDLMDNPIIMQFTGILDKDGTDIYEGDILKFKTSVSAYLYEVKFINGSFQCYHTVLKEFDGTPLRWGGVWMFDEKNLEVKVIGNIYENPELINTLTP